MDQADSLRQLVTADEDGRPPLRVVAVTSGKGGVGKTHVACNVALLAARAGRRVLLLDADLGLANADIVLGVAPHHHLGDVLDGAVSLEAALAEGPCGIRILAASSGVQELTRLGDAQKVRLVDALDALAERFDLVLVDCAAGIGDNVLFFAGAAQEVLLVVSPEPTALSDAYATVKVLSQRAGVERFRVVVNPAPTEAHGREQFARLTSVTDRFLAARVSFLGHVPRDESVARALMAQRPLVELFPRAAATRALQQVTRLLLSTPPPPSLQGGIRFLSDRIRREGAA